ncbi:MAG: serine/threonine-protein kinase, partial [Myxococcota bacterium]|nr:serine/threonine-protein kinase [Myxococcota bacterium]
MDSQPTSISSSLIGQLLAKRYRLERLLGAGAFGAVFEATDLEHGGSAALKILHPHLFSDPKAKARFMREAKAMQRIDSPSVVSVFDYGATEVSVDGKNGQLSILYIAMEYVTGPDLKGWLKEHKRMSETQALQVLEELLEAVDAAHCEGIIHRDLKPSNIMLAQQEGEPVGKVKILDFGVAKLLDEEDLDELHTKTGMLMGTPHYIAPDVSLGHAVSHAVDLYSLGVIAYELLAGARPFEAKTPYEILIAHMTRTPERFAPELGISEGLEAVVRIALQKEPAERFESAAEMLSSLKVWPTLGAPDDVFARLEDDETLFEGPPPSTRTMKGVHAPRGESLAPLSAEATEHFAAELRRSKRLTWGKLSLIFCAALMSAFALFSWLDLNNQGEKTRPEVETAQAPSTPSPALVAPPPPPAEITPIAQVIEVELVVRPSSGSF